MRLRVIACEVLAREVYHAAARVDAVVDITLLTQGLHDLGPERMRERLQKEIDSTDAGRYDAVALAYALCSRGAEGLLAREVPLAIPRAHDCITLLLGSRERYARQFEAYPGTYYCSAGWDERDSENLTPAGPGVAHELGIDKTYEQYVAKYGEENAKYIVEQLRGGLRHYDRLLFIEMGLGGEEGARRAARERAGREGWRFEIVNGDLALVENLVSGDWTRAASGSFGVATERGRAASGSFGEVTGRDGELVVLRPGERLVATHDARIMECERCPSG